MPLPVFDTIPEMQTYADAARATGHRLALVPTMGALHDGHLALVADAKERADHVTVSIFVNPTQFAPGEDYEAYPRTLGADLDALTEVGVDAVFAPTAGAMYPYGLPPYATVSVRDLDRHLCGASRPGHFQGVTSVVTKLYLACRPHVAIFGQKDAQQLAILKRMTEEMGFGIEIVGHPIVREADGLAMSSRNRYLTEEERAQAVVLSRALRAGGAAVALGERDASAVIGAMEAQIATAPLADVDYVEIVDADTLQPVDTLAQESPSGGRYLAAVAVRFGETRLIDNTTLLLRDEG